MVTLVYYTAGFEVAISFPDTDYQRYLQAKTASVRFSLQLNKKQNRRSHRRHQVRDRRS